MQPTESPLDQLADIHLPDSVSWWTLAPGWWLLLGLFIIALLAFFLWRYRTKQNHYRKLAQRELDRIYNGYQNTQNATDFVHEISVLLRRTALTAYPTTFNASIKGQAWLDWLDTVCVNPTMQFNSEYGQQLLTASYQKNPQIDAAALYQLCRFWLQEHRNHRQKLPDRKPPKVTAEANHV